MQLVRLEKNVKTKRYEYAVMLTKLRTDIHHGYISDYKKHLCNLKLFHLWFDYICNYVYENNYYPIVLFKEYCSMFDKSHIMTTIYVKFKTKQMAEKFMGRFKSFFTDLFLCKYVLHVPKKIVFRYNICSITFNGLQNNDKFKYVVDYKPTSKWVDDFYQFPIYKQMKGWLMIDTWKILFTEKNDAVMFKTTMC